MEGILTEDFIKEIKQVSMSNNTGESAYEDFTPEFIINYIAEFYKISLEELTGKSRKTEFVRPRKIAIYFLKDVYFSELSQTYVGSLFGKRDHSTVIHAINNIRDELSIDLQMFKKTKKEYKEIKSYLDAVKMNYELNKNQ